MRAVPEATLETRPVCIAYAGLAGALSFVAK